MNRRAGWLAAPLCVAAAIASATEPAGADIRRAAFEAGTALATSQAAIGRQLPSLTLTDQHGQALSLADFHGRALVVSPIYTSCYHICPTTTTWLKRASDVASAVLDESAFAVLTVGFDTAIDTPERMNAYARQRGIDTKQWVFASGDAETMARLLSGIGFTYAPAAGGFDHLIQATIVDHDGRIIRQVYGQQFDTPQLVEPLKKLVLGQRFEEDTFGSLVEQVRLFCTVFDAKSGRYRFDYSIILGFAIGVFCLGGVAIFIWRSWRAQARGSRVS